MKKFFLLAGIVLCLSVSAYGEVIEAESKVTAAVIYTDSAQVTREAEVNLKAGFNEVTFVNVPENLNEATLRH